MASLLVLMGVDLIRMIVLSTIMYLVSSRVNTDRVTGTPVLMGCANSLLIGGVTGPVMIDPGLLSISTRLGLLTGTGCRDPPYPSLLYADGFIDWVMAA